MVYTAPSHTVPDPAVLSRLTTATANPWTLEKTLRDLTQFKDCCGEQGTTAEAGSSSKSELLKKDFKFKTFKEAWRFMGRIADKAESMKHHPEWSNVYNRVSIALTTHSANSTITSLDTELAEACDAAERNVISQRPPKKDAPTNPAHTADSASSAARDLPNNASAKAVREENQKS